MKTHRGAWFSVAALALAIAANSAFSQQPPPPPKRPGPNQPPMGTDNPPVGNPQSQLNLNNPGSPQQMMQRQNQLLQAQRMMPGQSAGAPAAQTQQGIGQKPVLGAQAGGLGLPSQSGGSGSLLGRTQQPMGPGGAGLNPGGNPAGGALNPAIGFSRASGPTSNRGGDGVVSGNFLNSTASTTSLLRPSPLESLR